MTELEGRCRVVLDHGPNPDIRGGYWGPAPGEGKTSVPVKTFAEASRACRRYIEENGLGGGNWSGGQVYCGRKLVARVSYNGRVWSPSGQSLAGVATMKGRRTKRFSCGERLRREEGRLASLRGSLEHMVVAWKTAKDIGDSKDAAYWMKQMRSAVAEIEELKVAVDRTGSACHR
jgi:hypothetical protein